MTDASNPIISIDTVICAAFCGTGKTFICEKTDVKAVEVEYWKYKDKGQQKEYVDEIKKHLGKVQYIFISTDPEGLKLLHKEGLNITLVFPKNELRNEYLDRYIKRDSPPDFIGAFMKYWKPWINELKKQKYCNQIILKKGQYLQDVLLKPQKNAFKLPRYVSLNGIEMKLDGKHYWRAAGMWGVNYKIKDGKVFSSYWKKGQDWLHGIELIPITEEEWRKGNAGYV